LERATVVGAGPTGLAQAALLLRRGKQLGLKELTIVEQRGAYTRPVALSLRQINFDALKWLNPAACAELQRRANLVPRDDDQGFLDAVHFDSDVGAFVMSDKPAGLKPDGARFAAKLAEGQKSVGEIAHEMMNAPTVGVVTLQELEDIFWRGLTLLATSQGVTLTVKREHEAHLAKDQSDAVSVAITDKGPPPLTSLLPPQDLVVVSQGGNSSARRELGQDASTPASPTDWYVSGALRDEAHPKKVARGVYKEAAVVDPKTGAVSTQRLVRTTTPNGNHWLLAQVPHHVRFTSSLAEIPAAEQQRLRAALATAHGQRAEDVADVDVVKAKKNEEVDAWWREQHAATGPVQLPSIFGPFLFPLQGKRFDSCALGANCIAVGDSAGTSHFNVSAGAATGFTLHTLALDRYLQARSAGAPATQALQQLDVDVRAATLTWQLFGITQFEGDPATLAQTYYPKQQLEQLLPPSLVERYWPKSGAVDPTTNPAWHHWLNSKPPELSPAQIAAVAAVNDDAERAQREPRLSA
jgi:2-polyprenyl-6-methoxyphenol hydroxylase-like FAD-dependent oxidoreductase